MWEGCSKGRIYSSLSSFFPHSRNKFSGLAAHPGFDEKLCYGDITLAFRHTTCVQNLTSNDRRLIERTRVKNEEAVTVEKAEEAMEAEQPKKLGMRWVTDQSGSKVIAKGLGLTL